MSNPNLHIGDRVSATFISPPTERETLTMVEGTVIAQDDHTVTFSVEVARSLLADWDVAIYD